MWCCHCSRTFSKSGSSQSSQLAELFSKIAHPPHECEPDYQEPQEDRIALQELLRSVIMQQKSKMLSKDFKSMDQRFEDTVAHIGSHLTASSAEGTNQPGLNHHRQPHSQHRASTPTSTPPLAALQTATPQPAAISHPPGFQMPNEVHCIFIMLNSHGQLSLSSNPQQSDQQPGQIRRRITKKSRPKESTEVAAVIQDIKENHLSISQDQINADHQEAQSEEELLQGLILQEWYQGDVQGYSADQIKSAIIKATQTNWSSRS